MIPEHVVALVVVIFIGWVLFRWGGLIFLAYALWHFWAGEWFSAGFAFVVACFIEKVKARVMWRARHYYGYRGPWI